MAKPNARRRVAALVTFCIIVLPSAHYQALAQSPDASREIDGGWPRTYVTAANAQLVLYQPQVASWDGRKKMVAYAAVSYQPTGASTPKLGTVRVEADTSVGMDERLVQISPLRIAEANFPTLDRDQIRDLVAKIDGGIPDEERVIALDRVLASIDKSQIIPRNLKGVRADPPAIFYSARPAVLVIFDGEPVWSPIAQNDLKFAVNTNWDVFWHQPSSTYYLRRDNDWFKAGDVRGPWSAAGTLPESFSKLPSDDNWKETRATLPAKSVPAANVPRVFVSIVPAELILLKGAPLYSSVSGTRLNWVSNTESDLFRLGLTGNFYYLVSGRWFSAPDFSGPWTFATPTLPEDFKKISLAHPRSRVLASVPGTSQAAEAVLLAQVPQTARVKRKELKAPDVAYQGSPQFEPIEQTTVARAVNTDKDIIKVGDLYYMCFQGVWFMARSPNGPWEVTNSVPGQIYEIPVSSPAHNVTYVMVEDSDDEWVTFAAYAGYTGLMVGWGCAVWGTGWYYPPYVWYGGFYPVYYPFYPTYGYGAWYNPWTGAYGRGAAWYGPYGGAGVGARYNPATGVYSRGAAAWGPGGVRAGAEAYNPRTGTYARTSQGAGVYGSWGSTSVQRGNQWAQTARVSNRATGTTTRVTQGSGGGTAVTRRGPQGSGGVARTGSGDVYAGRDGNVYRRQDGSWQKFENGAWGSVDRPTPQNRSAGTGGTTNRAGGAATRQSTTPDTVQQLDRDRTARSEGTSRTRDFSTARSSGNRSSGSYRPSGGSRAGAGRTGGARGGGRRR
jgi:hypothetical protein